MQPLERKPWAATLVPAGCIPVVWLVAYCLADAVRCGTAHAQFVALVGACYITIVVAGLVLIAAIVLNAWLGPFPLRWWQRACGLLAIAAPIAGVFMGLDRMHDPAVCFIGL